MSEKQKSAEAPFRDQGVDLRNEYTIFGKNVNPVELDGGGRGYAILLPPYRPYPSVTTVIEEIAPNAFFVSRREQIGAEASDAELAEGSRIGKDVHAFGHAFAVERKQVETSFGVCNVDNPPDELGPMVKVLRGFFNRRVERVYGAELSVWSHKHRYAGALDLVAKLYHVEAPAILDYKTSNTISKEVPRQLEAYRRAFNELRGDDLGFPPAEGRYIVHIDKNKPESEATVKPYPVHTSLSDFAAFLTYRQAFLRKRGF